MGKLLLLFIISILLASTVQARVEKYEHPDIKSDFCGSKMGVYYCKCAFHNEYCANINMDKSSASSHVYGEFDKFVEGEIKAFGLACMINGGIYSSARPRCEYCEGKKVRIKGVCADPEDTRPIEEIYNLPNPSEIPVIETEGLPEMGVRGWGDITNAEGEFFVYSAGFKKWRGPIRRQTKLFPGDMVVIKEGRGELNLGGTSRLRLNSETTLIVPTPAKKRTVLERGILNIWENLKRLGRNEAFEVEGGHSISGIKGTEFIMQVDDDGTATYTVKEGIVEVASKSNPSDSRDLNDGESAKVTKSGVQDNPYEWDKLAEENDWSEWGPQIEYTGPEEDIQPDFIYPPEAAYEKDWYGEVEEGEVSWMWYALVLMAIVGAFFYLKEHPIN